mmetsp:Transcript_114575/g.202183  ORF Transcript_114575/g.202183 Transcript_114575/m.202183 type:complete len:266 (+) Transcript_114575:572-1369(+)
MWRLPGVALLNAQSVVPLNQRSLEAVVHKTLRSHAPHTIVRVASRQYSQLLQAQLLPCPSLDGISSGLSELLPAVQSDMPRAPAHSHTVLRDSKQWVRTQKTAAASSHPLRHRSREADWQLLAPCQTWQHSQYDRGVSKSLHLPWAASNNRQATLSPAPPWLLDQALCLCLDLCSGSWLGLCLGLCLWLGCLFTFLPFCKSGKGGGFGLCFPFGLALAFALGLSLALGLRFRLRFRRWNFYGWSFCSDLLLGCRSCCGLLNCSHR